MLWTEEFVDNFNTKQIDQHVNVLLPCLSKVGQNIYDTNEESFPNGWNVSMRTICIQSL